MSYANRSLQGFTWRLQSNSSTPFRSTLCIRPQEVLLENSDYLQGLIYLEFELSVMEGAELERPVFAARAIDTCHISGLEDFREGLQGICNGTGAGAVALGSFEGQVGFSIEDHDPAHALALARIGFFYPSVLRARSKEKPNPRRDEHEVISFEMLLEVHYASVMGIVAGIAELLRTLDAQ